MKHALFLIAMALPTSIFAQQQQTPQQKPAVVQTEHEHKGATHVHKGAVAPVERHTVTRYRYHRGYKRAQAAAPAAPAQPTAPSKVPENVQQAGEDKK